jgi:putative molybdopterin biosynthesis protein
MIDPADVAALLSAGVFRLPAKVVPEVAIVPTGSELVDWREAAAGKPMPPGAIIETNSVFLAGLVRRAGGNPRLLPRCPDRPEALASAVNEAIATGAHLVIVNAGASAGTEDHTVNVLADLGTVIAHGITVMPGKPTILASVEGRPVVGSPGYPVSAWVCFEELVAPALAMLRGQPPPERETVTAIPARRLASKLGQEEHVRVHLGRVGEQIIATPLKRGAGIITSLTRADGIVRIPATSEGVDEGTEVTAQLLRPRSAVERTLVVVGSHDVTLDLLADQIKRIAPKVHMSSSNLGSLAGLVAIAAGRCHLGGTHLLDPETGEYNVSYVRRVLPDTRVRLVTLALRQQGLMIKRGNPKGIKGLEDLGRPDIRFVNRQPGSGTRVLLDYQLGRIGLAPEAVRGYEDDEYTHTAVAVRVLAGGADAGLGVLAAARALGLDFIPVAQERYDLCIPVAYLEDERVQALLAALDAPAFRRAVEEMGGYDVTPMGKTAWEG